MNWMIVMVAVVIGGVAVIMILVGVVLVGVSRLARGREGQVAGGMALRDAAGRGAVARRAYEGKKYLLSKGEAAFFGVLREAVVGEYVVMAKVRLADVVFTRGRGAALNRVCMKHVDFVLLDGRDLSIRGVVELDDASHERAERRARDGFVDGVLREAGVAVVRVRAASAYGVADVAVKVKEAMVS